MRRREAVMLWHLKIGKQIPSKRLMSVAYRMDITKCPYNSYFTELGTPELTKIFCINDECTYGDIPGLEFIRHTTLGTGGGPV